MAKDNARRVDEIEVIIGDSLAIENFYLAVEGGEFASDADDVLNFSFCDEPDGFVRFYVRRSELVEQVVFGGDATGNVDLAGSI